MNRRTTGFILITASLGLLLLVLITGNRQPTPRAVVESNDSTEAFSRTDDSINRHPQGPGDDPLHNSGAGTGNTAINDDPGANQDLPGGNGAGEPVADNDASPAPSSPASTANGNTDETTPVLSQHVRNVITEVQTRQLDGQWEEALNEMNALYENFDELNPFEQVTLLNFYTNTLLALEMWEESITAFSQMLTIPDLRPDIDARAQIALGQLHSRIGDPEAAISYYEGALTVTSTREDMAAQTQRVQQLLSEAREAGETR